MPLNPTDLRVAANVRAEMGRHALSQSSLADKLGRSQQSLSRRLTGRTSFSVAELEHIAELLAVPLSKLLDDASKVSA